MKISLALGLASTLGTFALMGGAPNTAHAVDANHSGTICRNYNAAEVTDIDYLTSGTRNLNSSARYVICPLVTSPTATVNAITVVAVDGFAAPGQSISCTLYSFDYLNRMLGSKSFSRLTGQFHSFLSFSIPGSSSSYGASSVLCVLPPSAEGVIYDIDVVQ